jgi:hypothetical protein
VLGMRSNRWSWAYSSVPGSEAILLEGYAEQPNCHCLKLVTAHYSSGANFSAPSGTTTPEFPRYAASNA